MALVRRVPLRRAQLIRPFGVGSLVVGADGASMITAGLDHWYKRESETSVNLQPDEFVVSEWRLEEALAVDHFRLPPDLRRGRTQGEVPNTGLRVPMLRFPQWHYCPSCHHLSNLPLTYKEIGECTCRPQGRKPRLLQVRFVGMCALGHLFDFPWREWVHRTSRPLCNRPMQLLATGRARCECGESRSLRGVTYGSSLSLNEDERYRCPGTTPWLGSEASSICDENVRATFRTSSNVYFAHTRSSIYVPRETSSAPDALMQVLEQPPLSTFIDLSRKAGFEPTATTLKAQQPRLLQPWGDEAIEAALQTVQRGDGVAHPAVSDGDDRETAFRRAEFSILRKASDHPEITIRDTSLGAYADILSQRAKGITLIERLRATEVFVGFSRVEFEDSLEDHERRNLLRREPLAPDADWLPAHVTHGEGIFIELDESKLQAWETLPAVQERCNTLLRRLEQANGGHGQRGLSPRFLLMHTFAHLVINRLTYESGYSSAALRERLYVSADATAPMAGVLIYTAAGDSDGTLGGLVRLGHPGSLDRVIEQALRHAMWCSSDPVCAELGQEYGQGPGSCNLAACHSCALLPETACEEGNRFLDRALVVDGVGEPVSADTGFFGELALA